ncbi:hypothetical protein pqer_cds_616 [Pandoravirus quercus]|uniref:Uncharacterized protein n=2 Tax=Pandoravirus TaxID=2060084 RepID=A0A2U7U9B5_9VIRU|nr:hypothetical protein pqer_cds_616 [Pandoravirus quercus]AVK75038.1 hypothetical protein pqer_cds_616 [Pandoravirus quercus]QBZ81262.1 hypothetical protein pclt_cds_675 [Pandoravirus celtis]
MRILHHHFILALSVASVAVVVCGRQPISTSDSVPVEGTGPRPVCIFGHKFGNLTAGRTQYLCCETMHASNGLNSGILAVVQSPANDVYAVWAGISSDSTECPPSPNKNAPAKVYNGTAQNTYPATFTVGPSWPLFNTFFAVTCITPGIPGSQCYLVTSGQVLQA